MVYGITNSIDIEFEQAPGAGDGQGSLACCSPWGQKESDRTELCHFHFLEEKSYRNTNNNCGRVVVSFRILSFAKFFLILLYKFDRVT